MARVTIAELETQLKTLHDDYNKLRRKHAQLTDDYARIFTMFENVTTTTAALVD